MPISEAAMVMIEAIIKPFKLDDVKEALDEMGIGGLTVMEVIQTEETKPRGRSFGPTPTVSHMVPKLKLQIVCPSKLAERTIEAVRLHGGAGKTEDGKITVQKIERAVRIRTGDMDDDAIS
jgi:nitrogen regulatory protein PII